MQPACVHTLCFQFWPSTRTLSELTVKSRHVDWQVAFLSAFGQKKICVLVKNLSASCCCKCSRHSERTSVCNMLSAEQMCLQDETVRTYRMILFWCGFCEDLSFHTTYARSTSVFVRFVWEKGHKGGSCRVSSGIALPLSVGEVCQTKTPHCYHFRAALW